MIWRRGLIGVACSALWLSAGCERVPEGGPKAVAGPVGAVAGPSGENKGPGLIVVPPDSEQFKQLRVEPVRLRDVDGDEVVAPGRVAANPNRISRLLPPVQGRVLQVMAKLGDFVEQGQPLVSLDSPDADAAVSAYLQADAAERQAHAALTKAQADLARTKDLYDHLAVAEKDVLAAQNDLVQARSAVETNQAVRQQALGLRPTEFRQPALVRAPISGKILEINVTPGEYRGAVASHSDTTTAPLMTIADLSTVWISSDVPEPSIRLVRVGEEVEISLVAFPGETFNGRVARIADMLDAQTRTLKVHVDFPNRGGRFRPEMFGSIRLSGDVRPRPVVPLSAIVQEYGHSVVFRERSPGIFERRQVTTGPRSGNVIAILSGLQANDRVVVDGGMLLKGQ